MCSSGVCVRKSVGFRIDPVVCLSFTQSHHLVHPSSSGQDMRVSVCICVLVIGVRVQREVIASVEKI